MNKSSKSNGFTLVELLVAMVITGIVSAAIFSTFLFQQKSYLIQEQVAEMQQNLRAAMNMTVRDIRMAGYDPDRTSQTGFVAATGNSTSYTLISDNDTLKTITYSLYDSSADGDNDIGRKIDAGYNQPIAENIENMEFYYTLEDTTQTLIPADLNNIRNVQITILAKTGRKDPKFKNTKQYTTPSGANWGPYNDGFHRSLLSTTVKCRNMGS
ncbi:MAG: prepilin-type cleavage/methylation domain-containing protein [Deltaproteobacteria bacterium]|nr:MAG: prepilin-type cleavage/methylation domain-containing protein [Deltaproteobacteria bacterium]